MLANFDFLQMHFLWLMPLPLLWLKYRRQQLKKWPQFLPSLIMRYPQLLFLKGKAKEDIKTKHHSTADQLLSVALIFFVLAMAQPVRYIGTVEEEKKTEPVDLVILVGTAVSMVLKDYVIEGEAVERMTVAQQLLDEFIKHYSGSRIGLTIMGRPPMLWLPFTNDKVIVRDAVSRIKPALGGRLTDMAASLQLINDSYKSDDDKVIVMITDGGLQLGDVPPQQAATKLAENGFHLYVIGIGSAAKKGGNNSASGLIYEPINLTLLKDVAEKGQGKFFHALNVEDFRKALVSIEEKHRKPLVPLVKQRLVQQWYFYPLFIGVLLIVYASAGVQFHLRKPMVGG